ncbi:uncharacterized protein B4U79_17520 [Dinothrombium tinctorium]|uniref:RRM domain-containing protein n=1 Tax=Dinothrombium tinctorium TaxID=1965070 RepID=A0A3S3SAN0_9ACAR|nr:uncharacterized protein B4U79_17520 [Dinothrombium tinctorium]
MDARSLLSNRQRRTKGRGFLDKKRAKNKANAERGAISDLRQVINRKKASTNVKSRLGFKSNNALKAKSRGLMSNAARNKILRRNEANLRNRANSQRVIVTDDNISVSTSRDRAAKSRWRQRNQAPLSRLRSVTLPDILSQAPISAVIIAPNTSIPSLPLSIDSSNSGAQTTASVLVSNLNSSITQADLLELFSDIGEVLNLQMVNSSTALITYRNTSDAARACQTYNNRLLDGLPMSCTLLPPSTSNPSTSIALSSSAASVSLPRRTTAAQAFMESGLLPRQKRKDVQFTVKI